MESKGTQLEGDKQVKKQTPVCIEERRGKPKLSFTLGKSPPTELHPKPRQNFSNGANADYKKHQRKSISSWRGVWKSVSVPAFLLAVFQVSSFVTSQNFPEYIRSPTTRDP